MSVQSTLILFHISKEHQITTIRRRMCRSADCFTFQKSIKSQPSWSSSGQSADCFTFQKSIKSQQVPRMDLRLRTVSHFKRASNHNTVPALVLLVLLFHISKEHQITTTRFNRVPVRGLFHISKEHQITICVSEPYVKEQKHTICPFSGLWPRAASVGIRRPSLTRCVYSTKTTAMKSSTATSEPMR